MRRKRNMYNEGERISGRARGRKRNCASAFLAAAAAAMVRREHARGTRVPLLARLRALLLLLLLAILGALHALPALLVFAALRL